jgi:hypothetical protein
LSQDSINSHVDPFSPQLLLGQDLQDTLNGFPGSADSTERMAELTVGSFIQQPGIVINEQLLLPYGQDWMAYILLGLLLGIALLWYFEPERLAAIFNFPSFVSQTGRKESVYNSPGLLTSSFFFINYLVTLSLFIFLLIGQFIPGLKSTNPSDSIFLYISVIILIIFIYRVLFIKLTGFIFQTTFISKQQLLLYVNINSLTGLALLPVLLLTLYTSVDWLIYLGIFILLIIYAFKWFQTFFLGKFVNGFSVFHLFMYLCTLEIIPLLALIKLLKSGLL